MGKTKNTIKINGHLYDATTGVQISGSSARPHSVPHKSVDGVITATRQAPISQPQPKKPVPHPIKHHKKTVSRHVAPVAKRNVQHSHTLMRSAVAKPATTKHKIKTQSNAAALVKQPKIAIESKRSVKRVDDRRLNHAKRVKKSKSVSRFGNTQSVNTPTAVTVHKVAQPQPHAPIHHESAKPNHTAMFEQAIHHSTSHTQPAPKKRMSKRQRIASYSALAGISIVLVGVVGSQSLSGVQMHMASSKAGFAASLPGYKPAGYSLGNLEYGAGVVAAHYKSNSDQNRAFTITQKTSSWDSTTLRDLFVEGQDKNYQATNEGGRTIYTYGKDSATWVDNGVWYVVQGTGSLSNQQLVDIAKSL